MSEFAADDIGDPVDDYIDALYAEWLLAQPDAMICNGHRLIECMERQWGWDDFMRQFPEQLKREMR